MVRTYDNSRREQQAQGTREEILETALALLKANPDSTLKIGDVAAAAGVSVPTIYRHFGNKAGVFAAAAHRMSEGMGAPKADWNGTLLEGIATTAQFLEANREQIALAYARPGLADVHRHGTEARDAVYQQALEPHVGHLSGEEARAVSAILRTFTGSAAWLAYRSRHGLSADVAQRAVLWAASALMERLDRDAAKGRDLNHHHPGDDR